MTRARVYIVEDEALIAMELSDRLSRFDIETVGHAARGEKALVEIPALQPDVVVMDVMLAGELTGIDTALRLREVCDVPVVFLSAYSDQSLVQQAIGAEPFGYLVKPFEERELHATIRAALYRHRLERMLRSENARLEAAVSERTAALQYSEDRLRDIFDGTSDLIQSVAPDGRLLFTNRAWRDTLGYSEEEIASMNVFEVIHPDCLDHCVGLMRRFVAGEGSGRFETTMVAKNGRCFDVEGSITVRLEHGHATATRGIFRDVTARKAADQALRESEERHRLLIEASRDAMMTLQPPDWRCTAGNPAAVALFGAKDWAELCAAGPTMVSPERQPDGRRSDEKRAALIETALAEGSAFFEWTHVRLDGTPFPTAVLLSRFEHAGATLLQATVRDITVQKQAQAALEATNEELDRRVTERTSELRESEHRFRQLVEASPNAVLMTGPDGRIAFANRRTSTVLGYAPEELVGRPVELLLPDAIKQGHARDRAAFMATPVARPMGLGRDLFARRKDGSSVPVEVGLTPVEMAGGVFSMATVTDITTRKAAEAALRASEARKAAILEGMLDALITIDHAGVIIEWNHAAERIFGYTSAQALGRTVTELIVPPRLRERHRRGMALALETGAGPSLGRLLRMPALRADGSEFPAEMFVTAIETDPPMFTGFLRDITEREVAEATVKRLAAFPEVNPNPVGEILASGEVTYWNEAAIQLAKALGLAQPSEMLPPDVAAVVGECLATGKAHLRLEFPCGRRILSWSFYPIAERGVVHGYAADMTERVALEEQLRQSQKMEAIGQLAGGVAHDFNNILSAMMMHGELAAEIAGIPADVREALDDIQTYAGRAADLTRQLLLFSRRQVMQPRELNLNDVVTNLAKMLQRIIGEDISLELHLHPSRLAARVDAGMIDQVLMNLAVNARDAMPRGGRLRIETAELAVDDEMARQHQGAVPGRYVSLSVTDTGGGIAPDVLPRIFEPFFTTKEAGQGTGLGLATVFGIVSQHHGWLKVATESNQGSTFQVFLPATTPMADHQVAPPKPAPRGGNETILVVEDELSVRVLTRAILERRGYTVIDAASGLEALTVWRDHGAGIALVLTDLVMPDGISGKELARRLRAERPGLKVVFTSGYSADIAGRELQLSSGENFLQKPFTAGVLLEIVRRGLDTPTTAAPPAGASRREIDPPELSGTPGSGRA